MRYISLYEDKRHHEGEKDFKKLLELSMDHQTKRLHQLSTRTTPVPPSHPVQHPTEEQYTPVIITDTHSRSNRFPHYSNHTLTLSLHYSYSLRTATPTTVFKPMVSKPERLIHCTS